MKALFTVLVSTGLVLSLISVSSFAKSKSYKRSSKKSSRSYRSRRPASTPKKETTKKPDKKSKTKDKKSTKKEKPAPPSKEEGTSKASVGKDKKKGPVSFSKGQVSFEILGQGLVYSFFGSYRFVRSIALNAGIASLSYGEVPVTEIPFSLSVLIGRRASYVELLAGATINIGSRPNVSNSSSARFSSKRTVPALGIGYRFWNEDKKGFHFRSTLYGLFATSFLPWIGVSLGCTL